MSETDVGGLATALTDGGYVLDVREPDEYVGGHVPGAVLVPMGEVPARLSELPVDRAVYVICASGNRSRVVRDYLIAVGYDAWNVDGGTNAWVLSGRPVVHGIRAR